MKTEKQVKLIIVCILHVALLFSACDKKDEIKTEIEASLKREKIKEHISRVDSLKLYISNLLRKDINEIEFNEEEDRFVLKDGRTIQRIELERDIKMFPEVNTKK